VCNYLDALAYARREIARPKGLPLSTRLLCEAHKRLMRGARGAEKQPGQVRTSQNWIGGTRPGNARFVPPPADDVPEALAALDKWMHAADRMAIQDSCDSCYSWLKKRTVPVLAPVC
jgi:Fic family protein